MHDRLRVVSLSARGYIVVEQNEYAGSRENRLTTREAHHAAVKFPHRRRFPRQLARVFFSRDFSWAERETGRSLRTQWYQC